MNQIPPSTDTDVMQLATEYSYTLSEDEITVGHRTFSEHLWHLSEQKLICSAKLSGR